MQTIEAPAVKRGRGRPRKYATAEAKAAQLEGSIDKRMREKMRKVDIEGAKQPPLTWLLITVKQAAEALQISERTVHQLIKENRLESIKIGDARRIPLDAVRLLATTGATLTN